MPPLGTSLALLIGSTIPRPVPSSLTEALMEVEVTQTDQGRSGFQLTFQLGRDGLDGTVDYALVSNDLLNPFNRVILIVTMNASPTVLMDGIITHHQFLPSLEPGESRLVVTGEDVSVMMDLEEKIVAHPAQPEVAIAAKIIASYARFGLAPKIIPPVPSKPPLPTDSVPVQHGTDLDYLQQMGDRYGYLFFIEPGLVPGTNTAYWGPPPRLGIPQKALTFNMSSFTNVETLSIQYNGLAATTVTGRVQDSKTNQIQEINISSSTRLPPLSRSSALRTQTELRKSLVNQTEGVEFLRARARAQGMTDTSTDAVVVARGEVDTLTYGSILKARGVVGLRGIGLTYDGTYYVRQVTHRIANGDYKQHFVLTREGTGTLTPVVNV